MITLENRENALRHYEIPVDVGGGEKHVVAATDRGQHVMSTSPLRGTSSSSVRPQARVYPTTLTLCARATPGAISEPLPDSYAEVPRIAAALAAGKLVKRVVPSPPPAVETPPPAETAAAPAQQPVTQRITPPRSAAKAEPKVKE